MNHYISGFRSDYECLTANPSLARNIAEIYRKNGCWTWYEDYQWFDQECLMRNLPSQDQLGLLAYGHNFPINYIKTHIKLKRPQSDPFKKMARTLKGKLNKFL